MQPSAARRIAFILTVIILGAVAQAGAQTTCFTPGSSRQAVYYTQNNSISCVLDFSSGSTRAVVNASAGTNFSGLYVMFEGEGSGGGLSLVVGNPTQSGSIQVFDCDANGEACQFRANAATLSQVGGLALDTFGDIVAVNGAALLYVKRCTNGDPDPACASGWGTPAGPFSVPGLAQPIDVRFVSNAIATSTAAGARYQPGDVLVLGPSQIVAFPVAALQSATPSIPPPTTVATLPAGSTAKGLALFPKTGEILVATNEGRLLVFDRTGTLQATDFASLGGRKGVSLAIGNNNQTVSDPANGAEVFVTTNANGTVLRFLAKRNANQTLVANGSPASVTTGNPPYGVGNATLTDAAWTPTGSSTVVPARGYEILLSGIRASGFTQSRPYLLSAQAVRDAGAAKGLPVAGGVQTGAITGPMVGLADAFWREVPAYVLPMVRAVPTGSAEYYLVFVTSTGADFYGSTQTHHLHESQNAFSDTDCAVPGPTPARIFYATDPDDPVIIEDNTVPGAGVFVDITVGCGSHLGRGNQFSLFLAAGGDSRGLVDVVHDKLTNLRSALTGTNALSGGLAPYVVKNSTGNAILKLVDDARKAYDANDPLTAQSDLDQIVTTVNANPRSFVQCVSVGGKNVCRNTPGQIVSRATSAAYMVCGADPTVPACAKYK